MSAPGSPASPHAGYMSTPGSPTAPQTGAVPSGSEAQQLAQALIQAAQNAASAMAQQQVLSQQLAAQFGGTASPTSSPASSSKFANASKMVRMPDPFNAVGAEAEQTAWPDFELNLRAWLGAADAGFDADLDWIEQHMETEFDGDVHSDDGGSQQRASFNSGWPFEKQVFESPAWCPWS